MFVIKPRKIICVHKSHKENLKLHHFFFWVLSDLDIFLFFLVFLSELTTILFQIGLLLAIFICSFYWGLWDWPQKSYLVTCKRANKAEYTWDFWGLLFCKRFRKVAVKSCYLIFEPFPLFTPATGRKQTTCWTGMQPQDSKCAFKQVYLWFSHICAFALR